MYTYEKPDNFASWWEQSEKKFSKNALFHVKRKKSDGAPYLESITYGQIGWRIANARGGLAKLGIKKGDSVGIISNNRPEWVVLAYAAWTLGARFIPMYEKELVQTWKYIIKDSDIRFLLVSRPKIYEQVRGFQKDIPGLKHLYVIEAEGDNTLNALERLGEADPSPVVYPAADDIAALIYTSGTTGDPKGVLLSHGNLTYTSRAGYKIYPELEESQVGLSMLPWAHSYALSGELNNWIQFGGSLGFMEDVSTLAEDLKLVKPTYLISVPRVFNKIYDGIQMEMKDAGGMKKKLFDAACAAAKKKRELASEGKSSIGANLKFAILDRLVFSKIREAFGGKCTGALTASAAMNINIAEFFYDIGIPTFDCYGLSETSPAVTMNCRAAHRLGSVGKVLAGQRVVIDKSVVEEGAADGEIIVYGPNVMKGYHNKPEETAKVMTPDGGFRTGDRGRFDEDGFLWITGRIKEQYKLENGKYVFPAAIEEEIKLIPLVANAMVYGEGRPYNVCLVYPDPAVLGKMAREKGVSGSTAELMANAEIVGMVENEIESHLKKKFGGYEIPKKYLFLGDDFTLENGMLTQTLKLKRRVVVKQFESQLNALYTKN